MSSSQKVMETSTIIPQIGRQGSPPIVFGYWSESPQYWFLCHSLKTTCRLSFYSKMFSNPLAFFDYLVFFSDPLKLTLVASRPKQFVEV
jgi:hypothetical protein